jgi:hypothetical protein
VGARPQVDHTRFRSPEELTEHVVKQLRDAVEVLQAKAQPQEVADYKNFVMSLSERVAGAHSEGGQAVSESERAALESIEAALGQPPG